MNLYRTQLEKVEAMPNGKSEMMPEEPEAIADATTLCAEAPEQTEVPATEEVLSAECTEGMSQTEDTPEKTDIPVGPALFDADKIDESKNRSSRFMGLQFGTDYEEPIARKWFRRKK